MENKLVLFLKDFNLTAGDQVLFNKFSLDVFAGEIIGFCAPTGTGKTSLFNHIANMANAIPEYNSVVPVNNSAVPEPVEGLSISYVFQEPRLIPSISVLKNVMLPLENKMDFQTAKDTAIQWLEKLHMSHKLNELAKTLSGGEQQRTAIARAFAYVKAAVPEQGVVVPEQGVVVPEPVEGLLLLDEPFASQDETNTKNIVDLIKQLVEEKQCACLVISHDRQVLEGLCTRIITQKDFCA
jgi:ABC-type lipoprotein export system ATPase subunit